MVKLFKTANITNGSVSLYQPTEPVRMPTEPSLDELTQQQIKEEATQRGYELGKKEAQAQFNQVKNQLEALISSIPLALAQSRLELETEIADILWSILQGFFIEKQSNKKALEQQINQILTQINAKQSVELHLHPNDITLLQQECFRLETIQLKELKIKSDERLTLGGFLIKTDHGVFDASLEKQVDKLKETLLQLRQGKTHASLN